ncbi:phosphopantetheine-binding protein [Nocardia asiatica]|uniref:phosphopantetheine-binding protein n=1 Tax=Nocardia asiatica TaxID=209252 RepID=UPI0024561315|nr:phosphopantetheine-binding protein [Nocardia asiatica]
MNPDAELPDRDSVVVRVLDQITRLASRAGDIGISAETDLRSTGVFDSVAVVQLLSWAEVEFGIMLADQDDAIVAAHSANALTDHILRHLPPDRNAPEG